MQKFYGAAGGAFGGASGLGGFPGVGGFPGHAPGGFPGPEEGPSVEEDDIGFFAWHGIYIPNIVWAWINYNLFLFYYAM